MIKKRARQELTDIDVGPFSDISFLLIIFFILTTQIAAFKGNNVDIPSPSDQQKEQEKKDDDKQLTVTLEGRFIKVAESEKIPPVDYTLEELKALLFSKQFSSMKEGAMERFVVVQTGKSVPYEVYFQVMMVIRRAGGIACIVENEDEGGSSASSSSGAAPAAGGAAAPAQQAVPAK